MGISRRRVSVCLSVCVRVSHARIVSKRLNVCRDAARRAGLSATAELLLDFGL